MKKFRVFLAACLACCLLAGVSARAAVTGQATRQVTQPFAGVKYTRLTISPGTLYGQNSMFLLEADLTTGYLTMDVAAMNVALQSEKRGTVPQIAAALQNRGGRNVLAAVNGGMWMIKKPHCVGVTNNDVEVTIPRGFTVFEGEIIATNHLSKEPGYEGEFDAFGMTGNGTLVYGSPVVTLQVENLTQGTSARADGLNRLPADNALIIYSDRGPSQSYSLSDAMEVTVSCDPYTIRHGEKITGTVTRISLPGETRDAIAPDRLIFTARGSAMQAVSGYQIGDNVTLDVKVGNRGGSNVWADVYTAVAGAILMKNGVRYDNGDTTRIPATIVGQTKMGTLGLLVVDGRQAGYSEGIRVMDMPRLCQELGFTSAYRVDGGGSSTVVLASGEGYQVQNRPSDGSLRPVVNAIVISYKEGSPTGVYTTPTPASTAKPTLTATPKPTATNKPTAVPTQKNTPAPTADITPMLVPSPNPTPTPDATPSLTPAPTITLSLLPTAVATPAKTLPVSGGIPVAVPIVAAVLGTIGAGLTIFFQFRKKRK